MTAVSRAPVGLMLMFILGCQGVGTLHMVPLDTRKIGLTDPLIITVHPRQCHAWLNDNNELCVSMRHKRRSILGRVFGGETTLSLVLGPPPAGDARDYPVSPHTLRARRRHGFSHVRATSINGAATVWNWEKPTVKGRFRISAKQQSYSALTGWGGNARVLYVGEFTADRNALKGQRLLNDTEEEGMNRKSAAR